MSHRDGRDAGRRGVVVGSGTGSSRDGDGLERDSRCGGDGMCGDGRMGTVVGCWMDSTDGGLM
jgi:hypothetical protein